MADEDPLELVTIQYPPTGETMERPRGSLPGFTNSGWVVLDAAGRKKAVQPTTPTPSKES